MSVGERQENYNNRADKSEYSQKFIVQNFVIRCLM
jgi:hypothetical protein